MASCPRCNGSTRTTPGLMQLEETGRLVEMPGQRSIAGVQLKAMTQPEMRLTCQCGWTIVGYVDGEPAMVEYPQGQTPETMDKELT